MRCLLYWPAAVGAPARLRGLPTPGRFLSIPTIIFLSNPTTAPIARPRGFPCCPRDLRQVRSLNPTPERLAASRSVHLHQSCVTPSPHRGTPPILTETQTSVRKSSDRLTAFPIHAPHRAPLPPLIRCSPAPTLNESASVPPDPAVGFRTIKTPLHQASLPLGN